MSYFNRYTSSLQQALANVECTTRERRIIDSGEMIEWLCGASRRILAGGRRQFFCGNGASAAFASHMALDWSKNAGVPSPSLSDAALMTAVMNDAGSDQLFALPLRCFASPGDLLVTISSSGNSPNILRAQETARSIGMEVVTLSGLKPDNASRAAGDLNLYIPAKSYGIVECAHQVLLHSWLDSFLGIEEASLEREQDMNLTGSPAHRPKRAAAGNEGIDSPGIAEATVRLHSQPSQQS